MNMHEHLERYDESLIGMCGVLLIMFVCIAAVLDISHIKFHLSQE